MFNRFLACDGPTLLVASCIYASWAMLLWFHAMVPWWLMMPCGAYLVAWHFSLQHEAIHGFRGVPSWLRFVLVFPPIGLWFPFPLYRKSHTIHHRDTELTVPGADTESYYVKAREWERLPRIIRVILRFNQTLLGRLVIGPLIRLCTLVIRETRRVRSGDLSHLPHWLVHIVAVGAVFWFVTVTCGLSATRYLLLIAYPGMSLGLLRAFTEHRAADAYRKRTAVVESNVVFGLLFLNNNLHAVHHLHPTMPWYRIPGYYRSHRKVILEENGGFRYSGYWQVARRFFLRPVFDPPHPFV
jgi:fatty acid desaturase